MTKMRSSLDRFKLYFEKLPSDDEVERRVREYRRKKRAKEKEQHRKIMAALTIPIMKQVVAQLRRVKR